MSDSSMVDPWKVLMNLIGHPGDGSDTAIKLFWDDATMTPIVIVGRENECRRTFLVEGGSFEAVMVKISEDPQYRIDNTVARNWYVEEVWSDNRFNEKKEGEE